MRTTLLCLCLILSACQPSSPNSQILAQVGKREITQLQYEIALQKLGQVNPEPAIRHEIIEKLVQREQAIQFAEALKLDSQPQVQLEIDEARRDIIARAYADYLALQAEKVDENTVVQYYQQHPELFSERHLFYVREISLPVNFALLNEVKARLQQQQSAMEISAWLQQQQQPFKQQVAIRAAEQLPLEILPELNRNQANQTVSFVSPRGVLLYQVLATYPAPLDLEQAKPLIRAYWNKKNARGLLQQELSSQNVSVQYFDGAR